MIERFPLLIIFICAVLDIAANLLLKKSDGFKNRAPGIAALICVCAAFTLLAQVTRVIDLAVAYAVWGAFAIIGTSLGARLLFHQKIGKRGWVGILLIIAAVILLESPGT